MRIPLNRFLGISSRLETVENPKITFYRDSHLPKLQNERRREVREVREVRDKNGNGNGKEKGKGKRETERETERKMERRK